MARPERKQAERLAMKLEDAGLSYDEALDWVAVVIRHEALRLRCRCGKMIVQPSDGCTWHEARAQESLELRKSHGSVEA